MINTGAPIWSSFLICMIWIVVTIIILFALFIIISKSLSTAPYKGPITPHFNGQRFKNPSGVPANGFDKVFRYLRESTKENWLIRNPNIYDKKIRDATDEELRFLWVNHSTFLIQIGNTNILTDPIWSKYCSPIPTPMLKRKRPSGIALNNLPRIDLVLISHNHYDHMDSNTIKLISEKWNPTFITPLGNEQILKKYGAKKVIELDWWKSTETHKIKLSCTPTNHFSSRGTFDRNTSLWGGFILEKSDKKIYFVGDTGYSENLFDQIGVKYGPIDLSFIPIGAYKPEWFMSPIHVNPEEAVILHKEVKSKLSVAMHFGTFALADDGPKEAIEKLDHAKSVHEINEDEFLVIEEGQLYSLTNTLHLLN